MPNARTTLALLTLCAFAGAGTASAQSVEAFYKSKRLTLIVASGAGGGYDLYARVLARHYPAHIPGNPTIVVQNMPGASGVTATAFVANSADRDGSVILSTSNNLAIQPLFDKTQTLYDPLKFNWVGSMGKLDSICVTWGTSPIKRLEQAMEREVISSATGPTSNGVTVPSLINYLAGTKFRPIVGYSSSDQRLALERGEVEALCGLAYSTLAVSNPEWIKDKKVNILVQITRKPIAALGPVPLIYDFATSDADKRLLDLWTIPQEMGRPFAAPPGVPDDRLTALCRGFDATLKDPEFLAEARKTNLDIDPITGEEMGKLVQQAYATPKDIVAKMAELVDKAYFSEKK